MEKMKVEYDDNKIIAEGKVTPDYVHKWFDDAAKESGFSTKEEEWYIMNEDEFTTGAYMVLFACLNKEEWMLRYISSWIATEDGKMFDVFEELKDDMPYEQKSKTNYF